MKKLAIIRTDEGAHNCPYGLSVGVGCRNAGQSVERMEPLDSVSKEDREHQREHNIAVYVMHSEERPCKYADFVVDDKNVVHCDFGEAGAGISDFPIPSGPSYPKIFGASSGVAGYYSFPLQSYIFGLPTND